MVRLLVIVLAVAMLSEGICKPLEEVKNLELKSHHLWKRFINPALASGFFNDNGLSKIRTRRGAEEDCEKLRLCKLHASSSRNFLAAYELYFVNKENARLWDHQTHSPADCEQRFSHCLGAPAQHKTKSQFRDSYRDYRDFRSDDYDYNF